MGGAARDVNADDSQHIASPSGGKPDSELPELPGKQLQASEDAAAGTCAGLPAVPHLAGTETSQAGAAELAALPETEQSQLAHPAAASHEPCDDGLPAAAAVVEAQDGSHASHEALEDHVTQPASEPVPPVLEAEPAACDGIQASAQAVEATAVDTQVSAAVDVPAAITQQSVGLAVEHAGISAACGGSEKQLSVPESCVEDVPAADETAAADASHAVGADKSVFDDEAAQAAQAPDADEALDQQLEDAYGELPESRTPELDASGSFAQRSQLGSLSVTFSDVEMDLETGAIVNSY